MSNYPRCTHLPEDFSQRSINAGQRKINYAITMAEKEILAVFTVVKNALEGPAGQLQSSGPQIQEAINKAMKAIEQVASIRPPGCDDTWKPEPEPPPG